MLMALGLVEQHRLQHIATGWPRDGQRGKWVQQELHLSENAVRNSRPAVTEVRG